MHIPPGAPCILPAASTLKTRYSIYLQYLECKQKAAEGHVPTAIMYIKALYFPHADFICGSQSKRECFYVQNIKRVGFYKGEGVSIVCWKNWNIEV